MEPSFSTRARRPKHFVTVLFLVVTCVVGIERNYLKWNNDQGLNQLFACAALLTSKNQHEAGILNIVLRTRYVLMENYMHGLRSTQINLLWWS